VFVECLVSSQTAQNVWEALGRAWPGNGQDGADHAGIPPCALAHQERPIPQEQRPKQGVLASRGPESLAAPYVPEAGRVGRSITLGRYHHVTTAGSAVSPWGWQGPVLCGTPGCRRVAEQPCRTRQAGCSATPTGRAGQPCGPGPWRPGREPEKKGGLFWGPGAGGRRATVSQTSISRRSFGRGSLLPAWFFWLAGPRPWCSRGSCRSYGRQLNRKPVVFLAARYMASLKFADPCTQRSRIPEGTFTPILRTHFRAFSLILGLGPFGLDPLGCDSCRRSFYGERRTPRPWRQGLVADWRPGAL